MADLLVFSDDFESYSVGNLPATNYTVGGRGDAQVVSSSIDTILGPYSGTKMARVNWAQGTPPQQTYMEYVYPSNWGGADEMFIRFRYRCDSDMPTNPDGIHLFRMHDSGANTSIYFGGNIGGDMTWQVFIEGVWPAGFPVNFASSTFTNPNQWHTVEIYMKFSATTHITMWLNGSILDDGTNDSDNSGFAWTSKPPAFDFTSNWSGGSGSPPDDNNHCYIDNFEIFANNPWSRGFDQATTGLMSDATIQVATGGGASTTTRGLGYNRGSKWTGFSF